jgi:phenylalanyl-tRNA synthetase beta chain
MGGAHSEIGPGTKLMVLESAYFKPASVRRTGKRLGLKTEASTRFERGADVNAAPAAIERIATLLQQIGAAQPLGPMIDRYPSPRRPFVLTLRASRIARVLGVAVPDAEVPARLEPLGFAVASSEGRVGSSEERVASSADPGSRIHRPRASRLAPRAAPPGSHLAPRAEWRVTVPSFRADVLREIDLIEEIARHDGYASLPATFPTLAAAQPQPDPRTLRDRRLRHVLTACGLSEAMTFAFIERSVAAPFAAATKTSATDHADHARLAADHADDADKALAADGIVAVENPLSETFAVMRPSLLPGLVDAAAHNRRRQHHDVRLFEVGTRFSPSGETRAVVESGRERGRRRTGPAAPVPRISTT